MKYIIRVQTEDFNAGEILAEVSQNDTGIGGVASFIGYTRDNNEGSQVGTLTLEHYPGMTEKALASIADEASQRWSLNAVAIIHRVGQLKPGAQIVMVAAASPHRLEAFNACEFLMDYLKTKAPFWKKETTPDGDRWVDARQDDDDAAARWDRNK